VIEEHPRGAAFVIQQREVAAEGVRESPGERWDVAIVRQVYVRDRALRQLVPHSAADKEARLSIYQAGDPSE
jgi:hypothetical protein